MIVITGGSEGGGGEEEGPDQYFQIEGSILDIWSRAHERISQLSFLINSYRRSISSLHGIIYQGKGECPVVG